MVNGVILQLLERRLWNDSWAHGVVTHGNRVSRDLKEALGTVDVSVLVAVVHSVPGNGAERLAIAVKDLGMEGVLSGRGPRER